MAQRKEEEIMFRFLGNIRFMLQLCTVLRVICISCVFAYFVHKSIFDRIEVRGEKVRNLRSMSAEMKMCAGHFYS